MKEQFEFTPVFYEAQVHTFDPDKWMQWADTWIVPLQDAEGTYSFLLIDSVTYQTRQPREHYLMGFNSVEEALQAARIYLGQYETRIYLTGCIKKDDWPPPNPSRH